MQGFFLYRANGNWRLRRMDLCHMLLTSYRTFRMIIVDFNLRTYEEAPHMYTYGYLCEVLFLFLIINELGGVQD